MGVSAPIGGNGGRMLCDAFKSHVNFPNASKMFSFIMYADNTTLSYTIRQLTNYHENTHTENKINNKFLKISQWLKTNKLLLNVTKSKYMLFKTVHKKLLHLSIKIDNIFIERGHGQTSKLEKHVEHISNKCLKTLGVLNKLKHFLPINVKIILYNSLILPHFNYGIMSW